MKLAPALNESPLLEVAPDIRASTNAAARNLYGVFAEHFVCAALGLTNIPINGNYPVNFDAELGIVLWETKSVRRGSKVVIYDFRMVKEAEVAAETGRPIMYAFFIHDFKNLRSYGELLDAAEASPVKICVAPLALVHSLAHLQPLRRLKDKDVPAGEPIRVSTEFLGELTLIPDEPKGDHPDTTLIVKRSGYSREGYIDGWRDLPVRLLLDRSVETARLTVDLYGRRLPASLFVTTVSSPE